ncbi:hypothetical protein ACOTVX_11235 [Aliarcobacter butzleri]
MSFNPHIKSIVFELLERFEALEIKLYSLEYVNTKKYYSLDEFSELTLFLVLQFFLIIHTLYFFYEN